MKRILCAPVIFIHPTFSLCLSLSLTHSLARSLILNMNIWWWHSCFVSLEFSQLVRPRRIKKKKNIADIITSATKAQIPIALCKPSDDGGREKWKKPQTSPALCWRQYYYDGITINAHSFVIAVGGFIHALSRRAADTSNSAYTRKRKSFFPSPSFSFFFFLFRYNEKNDFRNVELNKCALLRRVFHSNMCDVCICHCFHATRICNFIHILADRCTR